MELSLAVLVSIDKRERIEVRLPYVSPKVFSGASLARLLDDVTLDLMESLPQADPARLPRYELCPHVELRKVKLSLGEWKGRISVVLSRYPEDEFHVATIPRLSMDAFAVDHPRHLDAVLSRRFEDASPDLLEALAARPHEYLEVLTFDTELPTVLPSRPRPRRRKKNKKKRSASAQPERRRVVPPITLRQVATNLTHRAADGRLDRAHLRDALVEDVERRLARPGAAILLVGPAGVGKSAIAREVTHRLAARATRIEERTEVWQVDGNRIIAGMRMVGAWEARLLKMVNELASRQDVLYVDDLPALAFTGRSAHGDANVADFLEPHLARGEIRMLGECTPERLQAVEDEAPGFFSRFSIVRVPPMTEDQTLMALVRAVRAYAEEQDVGFEPDAVETIVHLTRRFQANAVFPGKAMSVLYRMLADLGSARRDDLGVPRFERRDVIDRYARQTGLPRFVLWEQEARKARSIVEHFEQRIIAQPEAQRAAVDVVTLLETGLNDPGRPLASYLFVGPTGVGKTETAKAMAEFLFQSESRLIRLDMSEFRSYDSVRRLFGDRFQPDGELTTAVSKNPFSVVLLDEIEKAHPAVFDALLQVLGEGRLTNAAGRTVDFSSTIVVMTSNLGVREAGRRIGFEERSPAGLQAHYRSAAERFFRPEFFNRIDRVVAFAPLGRDAIVPLVRRLMEQMLARRGLVGNQVVVEVDPELAALVVERGFDERYGARAIKRMLEKQLAVPLAKHLATHYVRDLTIADIHPVDGEIRLALSWPAPADVRPLPFSDVPATWPGLERELLDISKRIDRIIRSETLETVRVRHARLIGKLNRDDASQAERDELAALATITELAEDVRRDVAHFKAQHFEQEAFEARLALEPPLGFKQTKTIMSEEVRPIHLDRGPRLSEARGGIRQLRYDLGRLAFRLRAASTGAGSSALLYVAPVSMTKDARWLTLRLLEELEVFLGGWGSVQRFVRYETWQAELRTAFPDAGALEVRGPGIADLAARVAGFYAYASDGTVLVRVESIPGDGDALQRVTARERSETEWREMRRRGEAVDPRPELLLRMILEDAPAPDPETNILIGLANLGSGLHEATLVRLYLELTA